MNLISLVDAYIKTHALNLGTDVIQHLKAFATSAKTAIEGDASKVVPAAESVAAVVETDVTSEVKAVETKVEAEVVTVESALEEVKQHGEHAFADLLAAQSKPAA